MSFDVLLIYLLISFWLFGCQEGKSFADSIMTKAFIQYLLPRCFTVVGESSSE